MSKTKTIPSSINGHPISYQFERVEICFIRGQEPNTKKIKLGTDINFIPEPTNAYDENAIQVFANGKKLGYVYKGNIQSMIHDYILRGDPIYACISSIDDGDGKAFMYIVFYR